MRVGMYEVREQLVHLAEGRFSLTGGGRYRRDVDIRSLRKPKRPGTPCIPARLD
jgi:hypothetical protein